LGGPTFALQSLLIKGLVTVWLSMIAYSDQRTTKIPNVLTLPAMGLLGGLRLVQALAYVWEASFARSAVASATLMRYAIADEQAVPALLFTLLAWVACFALWGLHVTGGGDAKALMGIFALFPSGEFLVFLAVTMLIEIVLLLMLRLRGKQLQMVPATVGRWFRERQFLPTEQQLEEKGRPYAWTFCLPGVLYLWFLW
jgi:Flp pilus assembly protein protease CpaA